MRMAELSRQTGVPVPTIKYYLREGLLRPGERTSPNQAVYDESHVRRLKMVRALVEVGGLAISAVREVLAAVDDPKLDHKVLGEVQHRLGPIHQEGQGEHWQAAHDLVEELLERRGWHAEPLSPPGLALTAALTSLFDLGRGDLVSLVELYAEAVEKVAEVDVNLVNRDRGVEDLIEGAVVGTVLGEAIITSLRRLAHQHASFQIFGDLTERE
ncbi:MerR family transcriptional regulator [Actinocrispum wychmicini]|uniref:MerR-like DNA binding protein n=1 Tax=Actinocrispum wychmicini TaxID=1213861 RepID=A0A4R2K6W0_9PSEU|nr:MerR family transcriptional regulator [Actinocrispum wychmicini]TCO65568.1 MerR-like DNA binding protein [Actinocrispum wychmicini]